MFAILNQYLDIVSYPLIDREDKSGMTRGESVYILYMIID